MNLCAEDVQRSNPCADAGLCACDLGAQGQEKTSRRRAVAPDKLNSTKFKAKRAALVDLAPEGPRPSSHLALGTHVC